MQYQLTIRVPFEAMDHLAARQVTQDLLSTLKLPLQAVLKLQQLEPNKPPVGVSLTTAPVSEVVAPASETPVLSPTTVESTGV
jgi:hypothetical protein